MNTGINFIQSNQNNMPVYIPSENAVLFTGGQTVFNQQKPSSMTVIVVAKGTEMSGAIHRHI